MENFSILARRYLLSTLLVLPKIQSKLEKMMSLGHHSTVTLSGCGPGRFRSLLEERLQQVLEVIPLMGKSTHAKMLSPAIIVVILVNFGYYFLLFRFLRLSAFIQRIAKSLHMLSHRLYRTLLHKRIISAANNVLSSILNF